MVNAVFDSMTEALARGERIEIAARQLRREAPQARERTKSKTGAVVPSPPNGFRLKVGKELKPASMGSPSESEREVSRCEHDTRAREAAPPVEHCLAPDASV